MVEWSLILSDLLNRFDILIWIDRVIYSSLAVIPRIRCYLVLWCRTVSWNTRHRRKAVKWKHLTMCIMEIRLLLITEHRRSRSARSIRCIELRITTTLSHTQCVIWLHDPVVTIKKAILVSFQTTPALRWWHLQRLRKRSRKPIVLADFGALFI